MEKFQLLKDSFKKHAQTEYPKEACAIITKDFEYIPCENISSDPNNSFFIDPIKLMEYEDNCWGFIHSHPDDIPTPSPMDGKKITTEEFKYLVGWDEEIYLYWYDEDLKSTRFKPFTEECLGEN